LAGLISDHHLTDIDFLKQQATPEMALLHGSAG
jgi:hypothetical protein